MTGRRRVLQPWLVAVLLGGTAAVVRCQPALAPPPPPPPPPAAFGTTNANSSETVELSQLTVAAVESGSSGQPQLVRQAFLASVNATTSAAGGRQTEGFGGFPWTTTGTFPGRKDPNELSSSAEGIVESDGTVPQCEVTVQLSTPYNTTGGLVATVLNLIFTNWDATDVVSPWTVTIINSAYRNLVDSFNVDVTIAVQRVIQGTVVAGTVPSNGQSSVPITLIVEADAGADLSPQSVFQNGRKCILVNVGGAAFPTAAGSGDGGAEAAEKPVRLLGPQIIGVDGNALQLKGVNWFGFDDGITMPEGLWADGGKLQRDLATITQRIRLMGFNAVRLPFSMKDLFNLSPKSCTAKCKAVTSAQVLQSVTRPSSSGRRLLQTGQPGTCGDVPPTSEFTCQQELALNLCSEPFMKGFCNLSCGRCNAEGSCTDDPPLGKYSCAEQKAFGKCSSDFMKGFCNRSCGRCAAATVDTTCIDVPLPGNFTCAQQRDFGKCGADFMVGFCDATCGRCTTTTQDTAGVEAACVDVAPPASSGAKYTCVQQKSFGKCNADFMAGYCKVACGRCATPAVAAPKATPKPAMCADVAPSKDYTCAQQKAFGKCNQAFMKGYCNNSCGRCPAVAAAPACTDVAPSKDFTCAQQKSFGKCNQAFMKNYCNKSCGRCGTATAKPTSAPAVKAPAPAAACADVAPSKDFTCAQQKAFGKCNQAFMKGYCNNSCGHCPVAAGPATRVAGPVAAPAATVAPTPPATSRIAVDLPMPPTGGSATVCNSYLPSDSVFNRFMYVVQFLTRNGIYVLLDNQVNFDTTAATDTPAWLQGWTRIAKAVNADSRVANRVIYDVLNEPDAFGLKFEPKGGKPGMRDLYLKSFDAIYAVNPASIMMIEGLGQQNYGSLNWGDGLITDPAVIANKKLSDPNLFFQQLLKKPYRRQVIVGVHVYPPSISKSTTENNAGNGLYPRLSLCHGYLNKRGYCFNGDCQVFPVVYGEWGSALKDTRDITWLNDMIAYMNNAGAGNDGLHNAIGSWFWWSWNMNSGDTGGILDTDWLGIRWDKVNYLERVGLTPWDRRTTS